MKKRILSLFLCLAMVLSLVPAVAFAAQDAGPAPVAPAAQRMAEQAAPAKDIPEPIGEKELLEILAMFSAEDAPGCEDEAQPAQKAAPKKAMLKGDEIIYVARVTDAKGYYVNAKDAGGNSIDTQGQFETLQAAINAIPKQAAVTKVDDKWKVGDGEAIYDTEVEAKAAAKEAATCKITMLADFEYEGTNIATVKKDQVVVLDLVGHDVTLLVNKDAASSVIKVEAGGNLTMMDSADTDADGEDCGIISGKLMEGIHPGTWASGGASDPNTYNYSTTLFANSGTFTMNSGKLHNTVKDGNIVYAVDCGGGSTLNVNGGWLLSDGSNAVRLFGNNINFNMTGGKLDANAKAQAVWIQTQTAVYNVNVNISGGTLVGGKGAAYALADASDNASGIHYNISGGYFGGEAGFFTYGGNVRITGGTFEGTVAIRQDYPNTTVSITGGTFNGKVSCFGAYPKTGYVTGGTFKDYPNYDSSRTLYVDDDGFVYYRYTCYSQYSNDADVECLTYNDYINAGYTVYPKGWTYGYDIDNDYEEIRLSPYLAYKDGEYKETFYIVNDDGYGISEKDAAANKYEQSYLLQEPSFYAFSYAWGKSGITEAFRKSYSICTGYSWSTGEGFGTGYTLDYPTAKKLYKSTYDGYTYYTATSYYNSYYNTSGSSYYQSASGWYIDDDWIDDYGYDWVNNDDSLGLKFNGYWKNNFATTYKGNFTYDDETYRIYEAAEYESGESKFIADGYTDKTNEDGTFDVVPKEIDLGEAVVDEATSAITIKDTVIDVDRTNGDKEDVEATVAADLITETLDNSEVTSFLDTNINEATTVEAVKAALIEKAGDDETAKKNIENASWEDGDIKTRVEVDLTKATVSDTVAAATTTSVTAATFNVKPVAKITTTNSDGIETTYEAIIPNEEITSDITFRLPVNKEIVSPSANIYHNDGSDEIRNLNGGKGEWLGAYPIQTSAKGEKFIELANDHFSFYTYEILDIADNSVVAIRDEAGNNRGFASLAEAVESYLSDGNEDDLQIILLNNCASIDYEGKEVVINLNGYKLMGTSENSTNVTIVNENEKKPMTLEAIGVYANDVSALAADGYDTKTSDPQIGSVEKNQVYKTTGTGVYQVIVTAETGTDRIPGNTDIDLFAGDYVSVQVKVKGARFVAADVTLNFDPDLFEIEDSPATMWDEGDDYFRFYNAKSGNGYYDDGYVLGTFLFKAKAQTSNVTGSFTVGSETVKTYVSGAWSEGWNSGAANALSAGDVTNASANIILKNMTASVTPRSGLAYTATAQALLEAGYSAKDNTTGAAITDATITYAFKTKSETEKEDFDASALVYEANIPAPKNAGDYVVFYKIAKDGYVTVSDSINVSIAKRQTAITWTASDFAAGKSAGKKDNAGNDVAEDFYKTYAETAATMPNAEYDSQETNNKANATAEQLTVTVKPTTSDGSLKAVGSYEVTVDLGPNYYVTNPTCTLLIDGALIEGYDLQNTNEGTMVWYDSGDHTVAQLVKDTTLVPPEENVTIKYSLDGGEWQDTIPEVKEVGKYELKMKITADSYYDFTDTVEFEIKNVEYKVEKTDYVTGWDLVLVYTNDAVPGFKYNGAKMYDVSDLGYEYGTVWNAAGTAVTTTGTHYTYVYAIVVFGDADITKVVPSNEASISIDRTNTKNRYDVNNSNTVDINDLVAVQGTYNVGSDYLNDEQMSIVLRADVSGNKKVDTYDCSLIKLNSGNSVTE